MLKKFCGFDVPLDDPDLQRYHEWQNAIFARVSVQATALYEKNKEYLDGVCEDSHYFVFMLRKGRIQHFFIVIILYFWNPHRIVYSIT